MKTRPARSPDPQRPSDFDAVVAEFQSPLLRHAERILHGDADRAQDAVQEVFLRYLKSPPAAAEPAKLKGWLYRVTHNVCVDLIRKEARMRTQIEQMEPPGTAEPPDRELLREDTRRHLQSMLGRLSENQRIVLSLRVYEGMSYRQISETTGLSVSNVGFQIYDGLKRMAGMIREAEVR